MKTKYLKKVMKKKNLRFFIIPLICIFIIIILIYVFSNIFISRDNICKRWDASSNLEDILVDSITEKRWVKCCIQTIQEEGVIKACKYIKID